MVRVSLRCFGVVSLMALAGCGTGSIETQAPRGAPIDGNIVTQAPPETPATGVLSREIEEPSGVLTLRDALSLTLMGNPRLVPFAWEVRAAEARTLQAGFIPNPELEIELAEFGGSGARRGLEGSEATLRVSQLIELGGKRAKRIRLAELHRDLAAWDYEGERLDALLEATRAFFAVAAAQRQVEVADNGVALAQQVFDAVSERVQAGQISPLERTRVAVALSTNRLASERAERDLRTARETLAASWGSTTPTFTRVDGEFETVREVPPLQQLLDKSSENPDLVRWTTEMEQRQAALALEKAKKIPDPAISAGISRYQETGDSAFLVGISIPLPIFGLNPGGVPEAAANLGKAASARRAAEVRAATALTQTYQALETSYSQVQTLKRDVLPAAERAFEAARQGYQAGKFGLLDVLDAQRTLLEARSRYIETLAAYHTALAEAERLIGGPLDTSSGLSKQAEGESK